MSKQSYDVQPSSYPAIYKAFALIDVHRGRGPLNSGPGQNPLDGYCVPHWFWPKLDQVERSLAKLSPEDLATFCCGEDEECEQLMSKSNAALRNADKLLNAFFDVWPVVPRRWQNLAKVELL